MGKINQKNIKDAMLILNNQKIEKDHLTKPSIYLPQTGETISINEFYNRRSK